MKYFTSIIGGVLLLLVLAMGAWHIALSQPLTPISKDTSGFKGHILAASDADMLATAYADGILNKLEGIEDSLSVIKVSNGKASIIGKSFATNSVVSWPAILAWHPGKRYAYVAETRGLYTGSENKVKNVYTDLPKGILISVIDLNDPTKPTVIQQKSVGKEIQGVSLNAKGDLLVAGSTEKGKELVLIKLEGGLLGEISYFSHEGIKGSDNNNSGFRTIEFHPTEDVIAANLNNTELAFFQVSREDSTLSIDQIGKILPVAKHWSVGNWHPNGKFFLLSDVAWGSGDAGFVLNGKGKLVSVGFNPEGNHQIVSQQKVGMSPEGFDVSPNGKYAIVVNMRRTYLPKNIWFVPGRTKSSLSLLKIEEDSGELIPLGKEYGFKGTLPEDAVFDLESNSIAVAVYQEQDELYPKKGWVEFWEVEDDKLIKTAEKIEVTRGVHNLKLAKLLE